MWHFWDIPYISLRSLNLRSSTVSVYRRVFCNHGRAFSRLLMRWWPVFRLPPFLSRPLCPPPVYLVSESICRISSVIFLLRVFPEGTYFRASVQKTSADIQVIFYSRRLIWLEIWVRKPVNLMTWRSLS